MARRRGSVAAVSEQLTFHVDCGDAGDGWTLTRVREIPAIVTQGATVDEAREIVRSALRDWLHHDVADHATKELEASRRSEPLTGDEPVPADFPPPSAVTNRPTVVLTGHSPTEMTVQRRDTEESGL